MVKGNNMERIDPVFKQDEELKAKRAKVTHAVEIMRKGNSYVNYVLYFYSEDMARKVLNDLIPLMGKKQGVEIYAEYGDWSKERGIFIIPGKKIEGLSMYPVKHDSHLWVD